MPTEWHVAPAQVGDLVLDGTGIARRGLLVRHLVLPEGLAGSDKVLGFIAQQVSPDTYVNIMSQYRPCGRAAEVKGLNSHLHPNEYHVAVKAARQEGITRLDQPRRMFWFR